MMQQPDPQQNQQPLPPSTRISCSNCGATTDFEVSANVARCAFCGSEQIIELPDDPNRPRPDAIISFTISEEQARSAYREWLGNGFFRPGDLNTGASLREIKPVYLPFWAVDAKARSQWTAMAGRHRDRKETYHAVEDGQNVTRERTVRETDWYPANGHHEGSYAWRLISASKGLDQKWVTGIEPFNFGELRQFQAQYMLGRGAEECALDRAQAQQAAQKLIEIEEQQACAKLVPGDTHRDLQVHTALEDVTSRLVYLPIWLAAFNYKQQIYRFVVNGQTGKVTGEAPTSYFKVAMVLVGVLLLIALIVGAVFFFSR